MNMAQEITPAPNAKLVRAGLEKLPAPIAAAAKSWLEEWTKPSVRPEEKR